MPPAPNPPDPPRPPNAPPSPPPPSNPPASVGEAKVNAPQTRTVEIRRLDFMFHL